MHEIYLDQITQVFEDRIILNLPEVESITFTDDDLDNLYLNPNLIYTICDNEQSEFWSEMIPQIVRIREEKREFYQNCKLNI